MSCECGEFDECQEYDRQDLLDLHDRLTSECKEVMKRKNKDYSGEGDTDVFSNFRASEAVGVPAAKGILVRVVDKLKRIESFTDQGHLHVEDEPVEDAIKDVINYMVLLRGVLEDNQCNKPKPNK